MKTFVLSLILTAAASAQTMRDSTYVVDSTASQVTLSVTLSAKQAAGLYRALGIQWRAELLSTLNAIIEARDPYSQYKDQYDAIVAMSLTNAQKLAVAKTLGIPDPRSVQVVKKIAVPVLAP